MPRPTLKGVWSEADTKSSNPTLKIIVDEQVVATFSDATASTFMEQLFEDYAAVVKAADGRRGAHWYDQEQDGYSVDRTHPERWGIKR